jgi:phospholipid/cholesterol/gamma-HCH transport system permease protein
MTTSAAEFEITAEGNAWRLAVRGDWSLSVLEHIEPQLIARLGALPAPLAGGFVCDWSQAGKTDIGANWVLLERLRALLAPGAGIRHIGNPPQHLDLLNSLEAAEDAANHGPPPLPHSDHHLLPHPSPEVLSSGIRYGLLNLGRWSVHQGGEARSSVEFFGRIFAVLGEGFSRPRAWRWPSVARHVYETGVTAIPIVALIAFLISVIVAYLGAQQLTRFGADIFVVDLVAVAVLRELGVLLTAIIVAGRSGSAFTAEIGAMQINEEVDALRSMGMNPVELLAVPRILGLIIALPLLTVLADAMGLAGGGLLSLIKLNIPWPQFTNRLREAIAPTTFWVGMIKAPVFAFLIAMVSTYRGMQVRSSARELGRLTTMAVVQSIFLVILADAIFAVLFVELDI